MTTVIRSHQVLVHAPLQTVFDYVSDLTRHPEWSSGQLKIEALTPGPVAVGKEYLSRGEVAVQKDRPNKIQIMEYKSPQRFGFVANDPDFGRVSHIFTFAEQEGGVLVERVIALSLNPIVAFLFRFFIYPLIGSPAMDKSLALLKTKLEKKL
ncbi:MAG TPA: SRPBCC family protein [Anaerolineales bacterium]|nr:SRPBCC family protein [Anaerolineales bacterium]